MAREPDKPEGRPEVVAWWMICLCRAEEQRFEAMTVTCCGGEALALFGHVEEAELFPWSLVTEGSKGYMAVMKKAQ